MNLEETLQQMISVELDKREQANQIVPVQKFCEQHNISRTTLWRAARDGRVQTVNIGRKVFVKSNQF